jgi:hypothetical protein|tara:strand:- start:669 stop:1538 length:870 start_codon:yes stop_codon:yes gene_type:complete
MELLKKTILLENSIDRTFNSETWGELTATTFYVNISLTQNMDNMGIFTDIEYFSGSPNSNIPNYSILKEKLLTLGILEDNFRFMGPNPPNVTVISTGTTEPKTLRLPINTITNSYNHLSSRISGYTDSKLEDVRSYKTTNPYRIGFDVDSSVYYNYENVSVDGHSRIISMGEPKVYIFDADTGSTVYGLSYTEFTGQTRSVTIDGFSNEIPLTQFNYIGEGWNNTNTSLSAITKEEYLFGVIFPPEVKSDVFIDRGITSVTDKHLRMSEISNLSELEKYGNGYYTLNKQ